MEKQVKGKLLKTSTIEIGGRLHSHFRKLKVQLYAKGLSAHFLDKEYRHLKSFDMYFTEDKKYNEDFGLECGKHIEFDLAETYGWGWLMRNFHEYLPEKFY